MSSNKFSRFSRLGIIKTSFASALGLSKTLNLGGPVELNIKGGTYRHVFGGGLGSTAIVGGNTKVVISGTARIDKNVYGGGNAAKVTGNTDVKIQANKE